MVQRGIIGQCYTSSISGFGFKGYITTSSCCVVGGSKQVFGTLIIDVSSSTCYYGQFPVKGSPLSKLYDYANNKSKKVKNKNNKKK